MKKSEQAQEYFNNGLNCAQSVFVVFATENGLTEKEAIRTTMGFGGGIANLQKTCGAFTGASMALGLKYSPDIDNIATAKQQVKEKIQQLDQLFIAKHGTSNCRELTGCDFSAENGKKEFEESQIKDKVCMQCVTDAVRWVEEL